MLETAAVLRRYRRQGVRVGCSVFALERGSYVHAHPEEFGITLVEDDRDVLYRGQIEWRHPRRVPPERVVEILGSV